MMIYDWYMPQSAQAEEAVRSATKRNEKARNEVFVRELEILMVYYLHVYRMKIR